MQEEQQNPMTKIALVVEDDRVCQHIAKAYLSSLGYEVEVVDDATTAINRLKEKAYHLIFTDFRLPDEPGTAVIQAARECEINRLTPIILVSAQINKNESEIYLRLGADAVLTKPYSLEILKETIQRLSHS